MSALDSGDRWLYLGAGRDGDLGGVSDILVRRHTSLDMNAVLLVGEASALVVDTGASARAGHTLLSAIREVTRLPLAVVLTHAHYDHCGGTAGFGEVTVYAHPGCRHALERGAGQVPPRPVLPNRECPARTELDLGGRVVVLEHPGPAHTDHDLVVHVPDADVLVAGDLVEQGGDPQFEDSFPDSWPAALDRLLVGHGGSPGMIGPDTVVVPGHGEPVNRGFVKHQREVIAGLAHRCSAPDAEPAAIAAALSVQPTTARSVADRLRALSAGSAR